MTLQQELCLFLKGLHICPECRNEITEFEDAYGQPSPCAVCRVRRFAHSQVRRHQDKQLALSSFIVLVGLVVFIGFVALVAKSSL